jgi:putative phosphoesterase
VRIGVISDTHGHFDSVYQKYFDECDEIWHAGDIGKLEVIQKLNLIKPCKAVFGNIDGQQVRNHTSEHLIINIDSCKVLMVHIAGKPGSYNPSTQQLIRAHKPQILVCGHSHIVKVQYYNDLKLLHINPGAAGISGFHTVRTILRFSIIDGKPQKMELIELGKRGEIKKDG